MAIRTGDACQLEKSYSLCAELECWHVNAAASSAKAQSGRTDDPLSPPSLGNNMHGKSDRMGAKVEVRIGVQRLDSGEGVNVVEDTIGDAEDFLQIVHRVSRLATHF